MLLSIKDYGGDYITQKHTSFHRLIHTLFFIYKRGRKKEMAGASSSAVTEEEVTLTVKWSGKEYTVRVCADDAVGELKRRICEVTNVLPKRQKLLYPKVGSKLANDSLLSELPLKSSLKMTMIGFVFSIFISFYFFMWIIIDKGLIFICFLDF